MADNVSITAGSGTAIAADEIVHPTLGTVKVQVVKLADGTMDGTTPVVAKTTAPGASDGGLVTRTMLYDASGNALQTAQGAPLGNTRALVVRAFMYDALGTPFISTTTAASGSDQALVVGLSPNSPLPAGTNTLGSVKLLDSSGNSITSTSNDLDVNLAQVGGTALSLKALPTNGTGQAALPVNINAQQFATYSVTARNVATGALTANTAKAVFSLEHAATSTKTVKIRRIIVGGIQTTALAGNFDMQFTRGTAASTAGTAQTPQARLGSDPAAEVTVKSLPTITAATVLDNINVAAIGSAAANAFQNVAVYDFQEGGESKPWTLRAGVLESFVINAISTAAQNYTLTISVHFTEE